MHDCVMNAPSQRRLFKYLLHEIVACMHGVYRIIFICVILMHELLSLIFVTLCLEYMCIICVICILLYVYLKYTSEL